MWAGVGKVVLVQVGKKRVREVGEESLRENNRKGQVGFYTCCFLDWFSFLGWGIYHALVLQIPCEKVFRYPKPTPKLLAEGIGA